MSARIIQAAKKIVLDCENQSGKESRLVAFAQDILKEVVSHEMNQTRLSCMMQEFQVICAEQDAFNSSLEKKSMSKSLQFMLGSRSKYSKCFSDALIILDRLLEDIAELQGKIGALRSVVDFQATAELDECILEQSDMYKKVKANLRQFQEQLNTNRGMKVPGAEYGLRPFIDIVLACDGQVLLWNEEDAD